MSNGARANAVAQSPFVMDTNRIFQIESSKNPKAHNKATDARGLGQITPIALKDYNQNNPNNQFTADDLWNPDVNWHITNWTYNQRIPQMLKTYKIPDTVENRIRTYHDGIGNVLKGNTSPYITGYVNKYNNLGVQNGTSQQPQAGSGSDVNLQGQQPQQS